MWSGHAVTGLLELPIMLVLATASQSGHGETVHESVWRLPWWAFASRTQGRHLKNGSMHADGTALCVRGANAHHGRQFVHKLGVTGPHVVLLTFRIFARRAFFFLSPGSAGERVG